ncbi:MAG TPA: hypothetical protein PK760_08700 [Flavobacteriales bacterium]|nr:hypothetical protein [Flavobacteriales bacterium]
MISTLKKAALRALFALSIATLAVPAAFAQRQVVVQGRTVTLEAVAGPAAPTAALGGVPLNDNCTDVTPFALGAGDVVVVNGDNTGATYDSQLGFTYVWEAFTLSGTCNDVEPHILYKRLLQFYPLILYIEFPGY